MTIMSRLWGPPAGKLSDTLFFFFFFLLRYYGCGLAVPECVEGRRMLDLGCGSGRDCYILCRLVGENGHVTGFDMTEDQVSLSTQSAT